MIISVASGKGGTGKTTIATNLALSIDCDVTFLDCDVEEPNAFIFLKPEIEQTLPVSIPVPLVDESKCTYCGICAEVCAYNAIVVIKGASPAKQEISAQQETLGQGTEQSRANKVLIFPELCHGCGACTLLCPEKAISEKGNVIGTIEVGTRDLNSASSHQSHTLTFVHGQLHIGEAMATPVIRAVKDYINPDGTVIIDAPPGTSCPVIESVKGSDFCILVTEPTPFGLNDLILAVEVLKKLSIPFGVVINRADLGDTKVEQYCEANNIPILMHIPFDQEIARIYSRGDHIIEEKPEYRKKFKELFEAIKGYSADSHGAPHNK